MAPPSPAETTDPLPAVQAEQPDRLQAAINQPTASLPLLDLLAPQQPGSAAATPGQQHPAAASQPGGAYQPGLAQPEDLHAAGPGPVQHPVVPGPAQQPVDSGYGLYGGDHLYGDSLYAGSAHGDPAYGDPTHGPAYGDPTHGPATMVGQVMPPQPVRRSGLRGGPLVAIVAGCVVLLGLIGWLAIGSLPSGEQPTSEPTAQPTSAVMAAGGYQFTQHSARADTDCAGNAYGQVADFFRTTPCTGLRRLLLTSSVDGRPVVVSVSTVTMPDEQQAEALKKLADTNGTGNVNDLLRAGVRVPSVPGSLSDAAYASDHSDDVVVIVESDYTDPAVSSDDALEQISEAAIQLGQGG